MKTSTVTERALDVPTDRVTRLLGHPLAFLLTALVLLALFGGTFFTDTDRAAPTRDPAYYTWRTEALMTEPPVRLLEIDGALGMFEGGYRVSAPILGSFLRRVADVPVLRMTVYLMVLLPVGIALLLAGFAYRHRRDPLVWHSVALGSGSLLLTPPFVGYLDNALALFFLTASLFFLESARTTARGRVVFATLLVGAGLTHPTTLVIFGVVLGLIAASRWVFGRTDLRSVLRTEGPMLGAALGGAVVTGVIWTVGIWGESASFTESALSPPYDSSFFIDRMVSWVEAMRPAINAPLFAIGFVGLVVAGRRSVEDDLNKTAILWLAPLAGLFGFVGGLTYPYYRFFNTTLAWVLLVGFGLYLVLGFIRAQAERRAWLWAVALAILVAVVSANFAEGFKSSGWNKGSGWMADSTRADLDSLRARLASGSPDRPVVFVIDDDPARQFQIWGFTKLAGNTSRYGLPPEQIDRGYLYLGDLANLVELEPTLRGESTYDRVSPAVLQDALDGIQDAGEPPAIVVASAFNPDGANAGLAESVVAGESDDDSAVVLPPTGPLAGAELFAVADGSVMRFGGGADTASLIGGDPNEASSESGALHALLVIVGLFALGLPGYLALRWLLPEAGIAEALGLVPALALAILTAVGLVVLAVTRQPMSGPLAWICVALAIAATGMLARSRQGAAPSA